MNYERAKEKLLLLIGMAEAELDEALPGRAKYDARTLAPKPFRGASVIHNFPGDMVEKLGLLAVANKIVSDIRAVCPQGAIAFVDRSSYHATTFDLTNAPDHAEKLSRAGYEYAAVRDAVIGASMDFVQAHRAATPASVTGIGMFSSAGLLKLNVHIPERGMEGLQRFRDELHVYLGKVNGYYEGIRKRTWNSGLRAHITLGYIVNAFDSIAQVDHFVETMRDLNDTFVAIPFDLTQGEVTRFSDMDEYEVVTG